MARKSFDVENPINNSPAKSFLTQNQNERYKGDGEEKTRGNVSLRLEPENMSYVTIISKLKGISRNKFINDLIADHEQKHPKEYAEAKELIERLGER